MTDILNNTPIKVDLDTNEAVAKYIIQALNINAIIKGVSPRKENGIDYAYHKDAPYHIEIVRNNDSKKLFACDARTIAFYAYDPLFSKAHKAILSEKKPNPTEIANVCEYLSDVNGWGMFQ